MLSGSNVASVTCPESRGSLGIPAVPRNIFKIREVLEAYALAGHFGLDALAVAVSAHLLAFDTSQISDALSLQMGPIYFRRLLDWHQARLAALKEIVLSPPSVHPPTLECGEEKGRALTKAWAFAAAGIVWEAAPGESTVWTGDHSVKPLYG